MSDDFYDEIMRAALQQARSRLGIFEKAFSQARQSNATATPPTATQPTEAERIAAALAEIVALTTDDTAQAATTRAIMVYRSVVRMVETGGRVVFQDGGGGESRTLVVRLRKAKAKAYAK